MGPYYDHISLIALGLETGPLLSNGSLRTGIDRTQGASGGGLRTWRERLAWLKPRPTDLPEAGSSHFPGWQPGGLARLG